MVEDLMNYSLSFLHTLSFGTLKRHWASHKDKHERNSGQCRNESSNPIPLPIGEEKQSFAILPGIGIILTFRISLFRQFILDHKEDFLWCLVWFKSDKSHPFEQFAFGKQIPRVPSTLQSIMILDTGKHNDIGFFQPLVCFFSLRP